jgi:hypothetical protein
MKDLLSKMTELQGTVESVEVAPVTATGKKVLNESSNTMKESTKPSLKSIFSSLLSEAEQVTIQPAKQNTQVIKQGQKTLGTVTNPNLANQIKQSIGKGEMSLAGDELQEDDMAEGLDPAQKQKLKSLIYAYRDATDPFGSEYDLDPSVVIDRIRQEFGDKIADTISQGPSMHYPRPGHVSGVYDRLADKSSPRVTKAGKINRQDAEFMKRNIKQQLGMNEAKLTEKAVSKSQQQAAGAALAAKRGDAPKSKLTGASKEMAKMPAKELEKFAKTKHKGLPDKKEKTNEEKGSPLMWKDIKTKKTTPALCTQHNKPLFKKGEGANAKYACADCPKPEKNKTDEAAMPTNDSDFGAGLGAGRNSKTLEAKKAKPDFLDLDKDGNKKESMKKAAADKQKVSTMKKTNEAKAKPDFLDLDKDGDKKEPMKKAAADKKTGSTDKKSSAGLTAAQKKLPAGLQKAVAKKKTVKEGTNPTESARLLGKAHAMANDTFSCKYEEGSQEAQAYLDGYKSGLDECYGLGGGMGMQQDIGMMPGMVSQDSMIDTPSPRGGSEFAFGGFDDVSDDDMMAFESWDRELNALLNEAVTPKFQVRYLPNNRDTYKIEKGFASKKEAQDWIKGENLRDRAEDISIETSTSKEVNEGKMKDIDIDMKQMSDAEFKKEHGKSKADMKKDLSSDTKKPVKEGMTVSISKGQQGSPDSVTISAQDSEADQLLSLIKQAGLGLFGGEDTARTSAYGAPVQSDAGSQSVYPDSNVDTGDHDGMMALMQKVAGNDYEDEESQDASCDVCGSGDCGCNDSDSKALVVGEEQGYDDKEDESLGMRTGKESGKEQSMKDRRDDSYGKFGKRTDEDETEDQMEFEVSEANAPDSGEAETTADENAEAKEDQALAGAMSDNEEEIDESEEELTEWANDAGYQGSENIKDNTFEQDIEFMTRVISGGLNGQKQDQTTLPHTKVKVAESSLLDDWKKLSGIR